MGDSESCQSKFRLSFTWAPERQPAHITRRNAELQQKKKSARLFWGCQCVQLVVILILAHMAKDSTERSRSISFSHTLDKHYNVSSPRVEEMDHREIHNPSASTSGITETSRWYTDLSNEVVFFFLFCLRFDVLL